jgi:hypothetical protein
LEDTSDSDSEVSNESSGVKYESDVMNLDQDFDDDHFVEYQSDIEETVTVVKKSTNCEIYGLTYKGIKIHLAACRKKADIKRLALSKQAENST